MKKYSYSLIIIIYSILLLIFSANKNICTNCKYYKKTFFTNSAFGKCLKFTKKNDMNQAAGLVNGNNYDYNDLYYCVIARNYDSMCGREGIFYEKKNSTLFSNFLLKTTDIFF